MEPSLLDYQEVKMTWVPIRKGCFVSFGALLRILCPTDSTDNSGMLLICQCRLMLPITSLGISYLAAAWPRLWAVQREEDHLSVWMFLYKADSGGINCCARCQRGSRRPPLLRWWRVTEWVSGASWKNFSPTTWRPHLDVSWLQDTLGIIIWYDDKIIISLAT